MTEWSSYRIRDFLLFSKESYWELVDAYNADLWPWQILWMGLALVILFLLLFPSPARSRVLFTLVAGSWAWVALVFQLQYFSPINWAARYSVVVFLLESLLLFIGGGALGKMEPQSSGARRILGSTIFAGAAFVPIELAWGLDFSHIMVFGWGPERTALGTLGILLTVRPGPWTKFLMLPPCLICGLALLMYYGWR